MRKSDICFYFSITKEENSDFDDNTAGSETAATGTLAPVPGTSSEPQQQQQPCPSTSVIVPVLANPDSSTPIPLPEVGTSEIKITENCNTASPYLTVHTPSQGGGGGSLLSPGNGNGNGGERTPGGLSPHPSPSGASTAMQYLNLMAKPTESNLLLPPSAMLRRGNVLQLKFSTIPVNVIFLKNCQLLP